MRDIKFFASYYAAIKELPDNKQGAVYKAIFDYAMEEKEPELSGLSLAIFNLIRPYLDSSKKQYENGIKGGRPSNKETQEQSEEETQSKTQSLTQNKTQEQSQRQTIKNKNKDIDIKKEINKEKNTILTDSELYSLIEGSFSDSEVCNKFKDYAEMRKAMGKNKAIRTKSTLDSCIKKLRKYAKTKEEALEILDYSIANCYQGLFDRFGHGQKSANKEAIPYAN